MWRHKIITAIALVVIVFLVPTDDTSTAPAVADATKTEPATPTEDPSAEPTSEPSETQTPSPSEPTSEPTVEAPEEPTAAEGTALAALATLEVKGRAPMTGYDRALFGQEWSDAAGDFEWSRDGCDTRNNLLARDLQRETVETNGCVVTAGVLAYEPYSGVKNFYFDKHDNNFDTDLDGEHVVALAAAYVTGAWQWDAEKRAAFANDPINLLAVNASLNRAKGDADFATWLPPNKAFRCSYAARQIRVKVKYGLAVVPAEKAAFERVLATCPDEPLDQPEAQAGYTVTAEQAEEAAQAAGAAASTPSPTPTPTKTPTTAPTKSPTQAPANVYYQNCDAVRAAGAAPIRTGDPGYGTHLDRDGDGIACE